MSAGAIGGAAGVSGGREDDGAVVDGVGGGRIAVAAGVATAGSAAPMLFYSHRPQSEVLAPTHYTAYLPVQLSVPNPLTPLTRR